MSEKHRESQPRAIALPRGKHGKFELGQLYNFSGDIDENIGNKDAVVNHRRQHLRHYGHQRGSSAPVAQSLPPAAPVIGSLPPPKMTVDDMPDLSLPPQSPEAGSIFVSYVENISRFDKLRLNFLLVFRRQEKKPGNRNKAL